MPARPERSLATGRIVSFNQATSVFLNCPYDLDYRPLFDASILAIVCCGFTPRIALDTGTIAEPRMARIAKAIFESKYSVHDLSRCKGEGDENLARFNMPLELGMAMARRYLGGHPANKHDWMAMVPSGHAYSRYLSDLAGFDPATHDSTDRGLIFALMPWLVTRAGAQGTLSPQRVAAALPYFSREMRLLRKTWGDWPPWADVILAAQKTAKKITL